MAKHSVKLIEQLKQSLTALPVPVVEATALSAQQAVALLADEILALRAKGLTYATIAAMLSASGFRISGGTLCTYMSRTKSNGATERKSNRRQHTDTGLPGPTTRNSPETADRSRTAIGPVTQSSARFSPAPDTEDI